MNRNCKFCAKVFNSNKEFKIYCSEPCRSDGYKSSSYLGHLKYYSKNREKINTSKRTTQKLRHKRNPSQRMLESSRERAKKYNFEHNICLEDIKVPDKCPILDIPIFYIPGKGQNYNSPTLDRIDNNKGYIKGNVIVVSWRANNLKRNGTLREFEKIVLFMKENL